MPADNKLELVVTVEVDKANRSIKSVNTVCEHRDHIGQKREKRRCRNAEI
ncbi:MAG: hypothetical protein HY235_01895 [Acidobacteria bacterium]|nr:hypothetical protein [Acidobacteriota bacterium]